MIQAALFVATAAILCVAAVLAVFGVLHIYLSGSDAIQSNYLGTNVAGTAAGPGNQQGVWIDNVSGNTITAISGFVEAPSIRSTEKNSSSIRRPS